MDDFNDSGLCILNDPRLCVSTNNPEEKPTSIKVHAHVFVLLHLRQFAEWKHPTKKKKQWIRKWASFTWKTCSSLNNGIRGSLVQKVVQTCEATNTKMYEILTFSPLLNERLKSSFLSIFCYYLPSYERCAGNLKARAECRQVGRGVTSEAGAVEKVSRGEDTKGSRLSA